MNKKIVVPILCVALVVGMLSGCVEEEEPEPTNNAPVADFTYAIDGLTVTFTDASTDADTDDTLTYIWDFGDEGTSTDQSPTHEYAANDTYTVILTVSDGTDTDTKEQEIIVGNIAPTAGFTYVATYLSVEFTDTSTDPNEGDTLTYAWDFGDDTGTNTTSGPITYEYAAGTYTVNLTVTDSYELTNTYSEEITVTAATEE